MRTADCLNHISPYMFLEIARKRKELEDQGADVISLSVGDPDTPTPQFIIDAMVEALKDPKNLKYPAYEGSIGYRSACARWLKRRFGVEAKPEGEVLGLIGSKEGIAHLHTAFVDPGDYVLAPSICYPVYHGGAVLNNAETYYMPMNKENGYLADFSNIPEDVLKKAKIMFLGYPNNPTGAIATEEYLDKAIEFCIEHDILLAHDNAYSEICYDDYKAPSILQRPRAWECCIEFFSMSKPYNMTGWRMAFAVGNPVAIKALSTIKNNTDSGQFSATQKAAIVAMDNGDEHIAKMCALYQNRRDFIVPALNEMSLECSMPKASIYVWAKVPEGYTSESFCEKMLHDAHVVVTPGSGYGPDGEGFIRISLTTPDDRIEEAIRRMKAAL